MEQRTVNRSRLYDADGTLYEFDAVVRSCTEENGLYAVTLDCTVIYTDPVTYKLMDNGVGYAPRIACHHSPCLRRRQ